MKAVLICNQIYPEIGRGRKNQERPLPPLVDRPFLQHVLETIIEAGAEEIDVILSGTALGSSRLLHEAFGRGTRWGVVLRYHDIPAGTSPYSAISSLQLPQSDACVLVAHADALPRLKPGLAGQTASLFFCWRDGGMARWTGWAVLQCEDIRKVCAGSTAKEMFDRYCAEVGIVGRCVHPAIEEVPKPLLVGSYPDLIEAHQRVLGNQHPGLLLTGREISRGVRISRNVTIHRTAKLVGPLYIGENCRISEHCHIGPGASIGSDCLIESRTSIEDSVVCSGSYVGEGLDLRQVYVDRGRLVNARLHAEIDNVDELLLGSVYRTKRTFVKRTVSWIR